MIPKALGYCNVGPFSPEEEKRLADTKLKEMNRPKHQ
jgi:hypothetical protein